MSIIHQKVTILPFDPQYAKDFAQLNIAWLERYFVVEPHDSQLLEQCEETIINKGGHIFFAKIDNTIVGTFALIKITNTIYELGKMAVAEEYQGYKIGQQLLNFCIDFAKQQQWSKLTLYSNTMLENAIYIYKKYGFTEIELEKDSPYLRSNIKMEFVL